MHRDKFPEKIPFRLTRMLTNAMEVGLASLPFLCCLCSRVADLLLVTLSSIQICGVHGAYSKSCEIVMRVMRDNKESLMAVLEAFVYDPLFAWKLVATAPTEQPVATEELNQDRGAFGAAGNRRRAEENELLRSKYFFSLGHPHSFVVFPRTDEINTSHLDNHQAPTAAKPRTNTPSR